MSLDTASAQVKLRSLTALFDNSVRAATPFYPEVCTEVTSDGADEEYGLLGRVPQVREWLGSRDAKQLRGARFTLTNKSWEQTLAIAREDLEDDRLGQYGPILQQLGARAARHPDKLMFDLINACESEECFDAQNFVDTDHVWGDSTTQSNDLTQACATGTTPTTDEFKAAFNAAVVALAGFKDDQGEPLNSDILDESMSLVVLVHPTLKQVAHDALTVRLASGGGDNAVIVSKPRIVASSRLSSSVVMDVAKVDEPLKPFMFQRRQPLRRQMKNMDDIHEKDVLFETYARYNAGYLAWWTYVRTTFT